MNDKKEIIMLSGVPASGKSYYAAEFSKQDPKYVIINRDTIRFCNTYYKFDKEDYISEIEEFEVRKAIEHNYIPIIDATNLNPKTRAKWENLAKELDCDLVEKAFKIDFKTALERDRDRDHPVGEKVLKRFFNNYFPELLDEFSGEYKPDNRVLTPYPEYDYKKSFAIICDLDGTLALHNGRNCYDVSKCTSDILNERLYDVLKRLSYEGCNIIFLSGREEIYREGTLQWLNLNIKIPFSLFMRSKNDYRKDCIIKKEIYKNKIEGKYNVLAWFDDRNQVVDMVRKELNLPCYQVYYGNF